MDIAGNGESRPAAVKPARVEVLAPAKLNLALLVGPRRPDGFHEVFSLVVPITLADLVIAEAWPEGGLSVACDVCPGEENLAMRAARELESRVARPLPARITVRKRVPHGAGLGGGSSDAAAAIVALERLHGLELPVAVRYAVAAAVGSDVPFFLFPGPQLAMGRGTVLKEVELPGPLHFVVAVPSLELSTARVYRWRDDDVEVALRDFAPRTTKLLHALEHVRDRQALAALVQNDLEPHAAARHPEIEALRKTLAEAGALAAAMSGSGSAVFGLFPGAEEAETARMMVLARSQLPPQRVFTVSDLQPVAEGLSGEGEDEDKTGS